MNIVGVSALFHTAACCLIQDGHLFSAAAQERFSRKKYDPGMPVDAFRFCLEQAGIGPADITCLAWYDSPQKKQDRQHTNKNQHRNPESGYDENRVRREIRELLGYEGLVLFFDHHLCHGASAFFYSGFKDAAVMTLDGVGEWATTTYGRGRGQVLEIFEEVHFPHSLGLFYSTLTAYLGFRVNDGECRVMGLASYGQPRYAAELRQLITAGKEGQYRLAMAYFDFPGGKQMYNPRLCTLLGREPRKPDAPLTQFHCDVAASVQTVFEEVLLSKIHYLAQRTGSSALCLAGGAALNCVANGRIRQESPFKKLFIQPAAGDDGACLGAAILAHGQMNRGKPLRQIPFQAHLGPGWNASQIAKLLGETAIDALDFRGREPALLAAVADRLSENKIVGWFQGRMEFGPRALGARSILANPMDPGARERLNRMIKKREGFRPFAPSVLEGCMKEHFSITCPSGFMLETCQVKSSLELPAITHVDGSARPQTVNQEQNPRFAALLSTFKQKTGCPILVNTSFNVQGEPIVCTPADALFGMVNAGLDCLVLEDFLIDSTQLPENLEQLISPWQAPLDHALSPTGDNLYTFV